MIYGQSLRGGGVRGTNPAGRLFGLLRRENETLTPIGAGVNFSSHSTILCEIAEVAIRNFPAPTILAKADRFQFFFGRIPVRMATISNEGAQPAIFCQAITYNRPIKRQISSMSDRPKWAPYFEWLVVFVFITIAIGQLYLTYGRG